MNSAEGLGAGLPPKMLLFQWLSSAGRRFGAIPAIVLIPL
jgi:hypothetical protein